MSGGAGNDFFYLGFSDRALGGDGDDQFFVGTGGGNLLSGGAGADKFWILMSKLLRQRIRSLTSKLVLM